MWDKILSNPSLKLAAQVLGLLALAGVIYLIRRQLLAIFTPFVIALAAAYILNPVVIWLQQRRIKRIFAVLIIYLVSFGLLFALFAQFLPVAIEEFNRLAERIPQFTERAKNLLDSLYSVSDRLNLPQSLQDAIQTSLDDLEARLVDYMAKIPEITIDFARGIFHLVLILILTFYLLNDFTLVKESLYMVVPRKSRARARKILHEIDFSLGKYIRGQLLISLIVGVFTYLSLLILGVDFALILGILAGAANVIPYFGPFIGAVPAVIVALLKSPALALKTALAFLIIQQVESNLIAPQILGKSLGLHPVLVILALLIGGQFFGILGMVAAVPVLAVSRILIRNLVVPPVDGKV